jgi:hypothetical protein
VADYFELIRGRQRIASCLHADTLEELTEILCAAPLNVGREALGRVGLALFMRVRLTPGGYQRRVSTFWEADGQGGHRLLFQWQPKSDTFRQAAQPRDPAGLKNYAELVRGLIDEQDADALSVRRKALQFYRRVG